MTRPGVISPFSHCIQVTSSFSGSGGGISSNYIIPMPDIAAPGLEYSRW